MGAIGDAMGAYTQVLLDQTDGSVEQINHALATSQLCWNLALYPDDQREAAIADIQLTTKMNNEHFEEFRDGVIVPMIERHKEMFPHMHMFKSKETPRKEVEPQVAATVQAPVKKYQGTGRNEPCPCNSGRKYKQCRGK